MWNWNEYARECAYALCAPFNRTNVELKWILLFMLTRFFQSFNRTNVELKSFLLISLRKIQLLLIEPMWNWNFTESRVIFNNELLLIEPMWNWNLTESQAWCCATWLLIEPMWNWNKVVSPLTAESGVTFNRTNVELKSEYGSICPVSKLHPFNRTNVELKWEVRTALDCARRSFNRTNVELKYLIGLRRLLGSTDF